MFDQAIALKLKDFTIDMQQQQIFIKNQGHSAFVVVYSDHCGYCHAFEPTFNEVQELLQGYVAFYSINGPTEKYLTRLLDVKGFPTLLLMKPDGHVIEYDMEDRSRQNVLKFIRQHI